MNKKQLDLPKFGSSPQTRASRIGSLGTPALLNHLPQLIKHLILATISFISAALKLGLQHDRTAILQHPSTFDHVAFKMHNQYIPRTLRNFSPTASLRSHAIILPKKLPCQPSTKSNPNAAPFFKTNPIQTLPPQFSRHSNIVFFAKRTQSSPIEVAGFR